MCLQCYDEYSMKFFSFFKASSIVFFCVFFLQVSSGSVLAASYYFDSVAGSDAGDGTEASPWQSIVKLQETIQAAVAGDTFYLKAGSSWNINDLDGETIAGLGTITFATNGLALYQSGTTENPITLTSYGTGVKPVLENPERFGFQSDQVLLVQGNYWVVDGLKVTSDVIPAAGISGDLAHSKKGIFLYQTTGTIIRNNEVEGVGDGISIEADGNLITENYVHDLNMIVNDDDGGNDDSGAVGIVLSGSNNEVSYNTLENCRAPSFDFGPTFYDGGAIEFFGKSGGSVDNNYIHHNIARNNEGFVEFGGQDPSSADGNIIAYNVLSNNSRLFYFNLSGSFPLAVSNLGFYHNTVVDLNPSLYGYYIAYSQQPTTDGMIVMKNNIFYFDNSFTVSEELTQPTVLEHTHNVYYEFNSGTGTTNFSLGYSADSSEILADPRFVSTNNFTLQSNSPAINAATTLGNATTYLGSSVAIQSTDYDRTVIPQSTAPDIGAYESSYDTPTPTPSPTPTPTPQSSSSDGSVSSSNSPSGGESMCLSSVPLRAPDLFQIDTTDRSATLYINPLAKPFEYYFISYSVWGHAEQFGVEFPLTESTGVISYTINHLEPNKTYYFKVRSGVSCQTGDWSAVVPAKTLKRIPENSRVRNPFFSFYREFTFLDRLRQMRKYSGN